VKDFKGKTAVVTGGASGIGRAIADRLAREGMKIVVADVEKGALDRAVGELRAGGAEAIGVVCDVSKYESVDNLARHAVEAYEKVHVLCNNAGVGSHEDIPVWNLPLSDWRWVMGVNVWGVIHGIKAFVPGMLAHGEEGHVVNTSSGNGGLIVIPTTPIYATSKAAISVLTEALHYQFVQFGTKLHASVLYPGPNIVSSNIFTASRNRPAEHTREIEQSMPPMTLEAILEMASAAGINMRTTTPAEVAESFFDGIANDRYFIWPATESGDKQFRERMDATLARRNPEPPRLF